jgi:hypothetical protein
MRDELADRVGQLCVLVAEGTEPLVELLGSRHCRSVARRVAAVKQRLVSNW